MNILGIITNISESNSCIRDLAKTNCLEIIIPLFDTNNCELLTRLCETCYNLTFKCIYINIIIFILYLIKIVTNKIMFGDLGGIKKLLKCVTSHSYDLLAKCLLLLYNITFIEKNNEEIVEESILNALVSNLINITNPEIQRGITRVLCNLSYKNEEREIIVENGGLKILLKLLDDENLDNVTYSSKVLWNLTAKGKYRDEIINEDGIQKLLDKIYVEDTKIKTFVFGVLYNITMKSIYIFIYNLYLFINREFRE